MPLKFKTQFVHDRLSGISFEKPSLTQQSFGFETDINNIVSSMMERNFSPNVNLNQPLFGQVISPDIFENAVNIIAEAKSKFEDLPSYIRQRFDNDPKKLLDFVSDNKNYDEAVKLGFIEKKAPNKLEMVLGKLDEKLSNSTNETLLNGTTAPAGDVVNEVSSH